MPLLGYGWRKTVIPDGVTIGKNTAIAGKTTIEDYPDNTLAGGRNFDKGR